jgi:hypothetical protein
MTEGYVYFLACEGAPGRVKIGWSVDPDQRRKQLQSTGTPGELVELLRLPGTDEDERALHAKFATARVSGEWFDADMPVMSAIHYGRAGTLREFIERRAAASLSTWPRQQVTA